MSTLDATLVPPSRLSVAFREGSQPQHDAAESSTFITDLMGGRVNEAGYVNYLRCLRPVYAALEETARALCDHPLVAPLHDPALERLACLDADLAAWRSGDPAEEACAGTAAAAYADAVRATVTAPERFVAHHYTRYLGDLSGGQAIGRILDRDFGRQGAGLSFYRFDAIAKVKVYKDGYRARLDALVLSPAQQAAAVEEVQRAFSHNQAVFAELAGHLPLFQR